MAIAKSFVWGNGGAQLTPEEIAKQREVEDALLQRGIDTSPVGSMAEGLARVANAAAGSFRRGRLLKADGENKAYDTDAFNKITALLSGGASAAPVAAPVTTVPMTDAKSEISPNSTGSYRDAIASIESDGSGGYSAVGPVHPTMGRALGRYQVMESNIGPWSKEALGREVSPDEFLADPKIQDAIFDNKFGGYVQQYGPQGAAQAWFAGPGGVGKLDRKDSLGTSVADYTNKFSRSLGTEVASAPPQTATDAIASASPMPAPTDLPTSTVAAPPPVASVPPVQVAQAGQPVLAPNGQAIPPEILKVLGDPRVSQRTRGIAQLLIQQQQARQQAILEQQIKQSDPGYKADLRLKTIQADQLLNPRLSPAEQARIDMDREKFGYEKTSGAEKLALDKDKFAADRENNALTPDLKEYNAYVKGEADAGRNPLSLLDYQLAVKKAGASSTNVTTGEGSSFYKKLDEKNAETFAGLSDTGMQARSKMSQIDRLEGLMKNAPQGGVGVLKQAAGEWGIPTEGLSDIQAASALLEKMVPAQRAPGSGPMSDADIKMFRSSLPRVINQPGGNQLIFQTMRGITQYEIQMGEIADRVANREIEPSEARRQIQELKNPLADFKISDGTTPNEGWKEMAPGVRIRKIGE